MIIENNDQLEYKNLWLFYQNLYSRLFNLINDIVDEKEYNILKLRNKVNDFADSYSYYIIGKTILTKDNIKGKKLVESDEDILKRLKDFDSFTESLNKFNTKEYIQVRLELMRCDYDLRKLTDPNFKLLTTEYYLFFNEAIKIIKNFIDIASSNGFLPNIKSKKSLKTIGYAQYDFFFKELENLKMKMSDITTDISMANIFKCRRCIYSILVIFSPYFKRVNIYSKLSQELNFDFLGDKNVLVNIKKTYDYKSFNHLPKDLQEANLKILTPLKLNVSLIKRYMSYEFGEIDMSPTIKKKYGYDPTWT